MRTKLTIQGDRFCINDQLVYREIPGCPSTAHGLLMNARFVQGIFDDKMDVERFNRFGMRFDAEENTDELIRSLPAWYAVGLRAFTVCFQGGGPCATIDNWTIDNNPFASDGSQIDPAYLQRMDRLIRAADALNMVVIVSLFYAAQTRFLTDDNAVIRAVKTACNWLRDQQFTNIIVEVANEHDIRGFKIHPILYMESGVVELMEIARRESGGMAIGCSGTGGYFSQTIAQASDVIFIHGNGQSRQRFYDLIQKAKAIRPSRPVVCNEDSAAISKMDVSVQTGTSWGYYNNMTKQEPPVNWGILQGEDAFFALRMAQHLGIPCPAPEAQYALQGLEPAMTYEQKRWIRLASLVPEAIHHVDFFWNDAYVGTAYDDPFALHAASISGRLHAVDGIRVGDRWEAKIHLVDGTIVAKQETVRDA